MAEADTSTLGGRLARAREVARVSVPCTRLLTMRDLRGGLHRPAAMFSPARCTTASALSKAAGFTASGSHCASAVACAGRRTSRTTWCPAEESAAHSAPPISPEAPVTSTLMPPMVAEKRAAGSKRRDKQPSQPIISYGESPPAVVPCPVDRPMATLRQQIATNVLRVTRFRDLMKRVRAYRPNDDVAIVRKAYDYSLRYHTGQQRASGEPYLVHPLEVAHVLAEMKLDTNAIAAGLLHDLVEDTAVTVEQIRQEFGEQVAHIVEGVTKISKIDFATREERQAENLRKMMLAMVDDIRVVLKI